MSGSASWEADCPRPCSPRPGGGVTGCPTGAVGVSSGEGITAPDGAFEPADGAGAALAADGAEAAEEAVRPRREPAGW